MPENKTDSKKEKQTLTKLERQEKIKQMLLKEGYQFAKIEELVHKLQKNCKVSKSTVHRDVEELNLELSNGYYQLPPDAKEDYQDKKLQSALATSLIDMVHPVGLLVLKTKPGHSGLLDIALREKYRDKIAETICNKESLIVFTTGPRAAREIAKYIPAPNGGNWQKN